MFHFHEFESNPQYFVLTVTLYAAAPLLASPYVLYFNFNILYNIYIILYIITTFIFYKEHTTYESSQCVVIKKIYVYILINSNLQMFVYNIF